MLSGSTENIACACAACSAGLASAATPVAAALAAPGYAVESLILTPSMRWNYPGPVGTGASVTYSFLQTVPSYYAAEADEHEGFAAFSASQIDGARRALQQFSDVANLTFSEVGGVGTIAFGTMRGDPAYQAYAYYPSRLYSYQEQGDIWLNNYWANNQDQRAGTYGFMAMLHELGHAVGLKHSFDASRGSVLPFFEENRRFTVMSYSRNRFAAAEPSTLMLYDVAALQYLYGANYATRSGDTVYSFSPAQVEVRTIWDGGGTDTFDTSTFAAGVTIDLQDGEFSSLGGFLNTAIAYGAVIENAIGGSGADTISGNSANNRLDGGAGADRLTGLAGDDTYVVDSAADVVTERVGEGSGDAVHTTLGMYSLPYEIENFRYVGVGNVVAIGNSAANLLEGGAGNDILVGDSGNDTLIGGTGHDVLDGSRGADTLNGGAGDDAYLVDNVGDVIQEAANDGYDTVLSYITIDLSSFGPNIEVVGFLGSAGLNVTGNALNNVFFANDAVNVIAGGLGNDVVVGYGGNDAIVGNDGDDTLDGSTGADTLSGGAGNDVYLVEQTGDLVVEAVGEGTDTALSFIDYALGANVEKLSLLAAANVTGTGNALGNELYGNAGRNTLDGAGGTDALLGFAGDDTLFGGAGDDRLYGGLGNDSLYGGSGTDLLFGEGGNDVFVFSLGEADGDLIVDFAGNGGGTGDLLRFQGYAGASLANVGADSWRITHSFGTETFRIAGVTAGGLLGADYQFA